MGWEEGVALQQALEGADETEWDKGRGRSAAFPKNVFEQISIHITYEYVWLCFGFSVVVRSLFLYDSVWKWFTTDWTDAMIVLFL